MPDMIPTYVTAERGSRLQNTVAQATEFVVVTWVQPKSGDSRLGWYSYETYPTEQDARHAHEDYERGEYRHNRAVCIFASRHGVPIGRIA